MIFDILKKFSFLISSYKILDYDYFATNYKLLLEIQINNNTVLYVRDYLFADGKRKYSFHWQDHMENCIIRWDNTPHHQDIKSYPFHKHIGESEAVEDSEVMNLNKVLEYIGKNM